MISRVDEHAYYYYLKSAARARVVTSLNKKILKHGQRAIWDGLILCSINKESIEYARREWPRYYRADIYTGFHHSWEKLYYKFAARPSFFDLAVWQRVNGDQVLQGMALGKPSNAKTHLSINWLKDHLRHLISTAEYFCRSWRAPRNTRNFLGASAF
jgi:hypothetical protein